MPSNDKTLSDIAYRRIRADVLGGFLAPTARLRLNELQARYDMGLSPIREALLRLSTEGLIVGEGQRGFAVPPVSLAELVDVSKTRQQIETLALTAAIERGDPNWEAGIVAAYHLLSRTPMPEDWSDIEAAEKWEIRHRAFHDSLVAACGSPWLLRFHAQLADHTERYRRARLLNSRISPAHRARTVDTDHRLIMDAVLTRETKKACALLNEHLEGTVDAAAQWLEEEWKKQEAGSIRPKEITS